MKTACIRFPESNLPRSDLLTNVAFLIPAGARVSRSPVDAFICCASACAEPPARQNLRRAL